MICFAGTLPKLQRREQVCYEARLKRSQVAHRRFLQHGVHSKFSEALLPQYIRNEEFLAYFDLYFLLLILCKLCGIKGWVDLVGLGKVLTAGDTNVTLMCIRTYGLTYQSPLLKGGFRIYKVSSFLNWCVSQFLHPLTITSLQIHYLSFPYPTRSTSMQ